MILKQDENLAVVAERAGKAEPDVAYILANALLNAGMIENNDEYYGIQLKDCIDDETPVSFIVDVIKATGIETVNDTTFKAFMECTVMGDGNCPNCGGEMQLDDCKGREIRHGYDTPPDYEVDWEKWRCPFCGHIIINDYRTD